MKHLVLLLLSCILVLPSLRAAEPSPKARAVLALAALQAKQSKPAEHPDCGCGGLGCDCCGDNCQCGFVAKKPAKEKSPGWLEWQLYRLQYNKAITQNKPLLVWVGEACPPCESKWTEFIHAHLSEYDPQGGTAYTGPGVMVCKPDGLGGMSVAQKIAGIPTQAQVDGAAGIGAKAGSRCVDCNGNILFCDGPCPAGTWRLSSAPVIQTPVFLPAAPCFGGNCGFGGCGGGGCGVGGCGFGGCGPMMGGFSGGGCAGGCCGGG